MRFGTKICEEMPTVLVGRILLRQNVVNTLTVISQRAGRKKIKLENFSDLSASTTTAATDSAIARSLVNPTAICPFLGKEAWVNHSGRFDPCCAPDEQRKSLGSLGTIHLRSLGAEMSNTSLVTVWQSAQYRDLVQRYSHFSLCQGCTMRKPKKK